MKTLNDQYDFARPSLSGKYGFEVFENTKSNLFYFHFNDKDGRAILFSQGYQSAKSRDRGLESVMKNATKEERYHRQRTKEGRPFFVLKAGNYQEVARSKVFGTIGEMEKAISLAQSITKKTPVSEVDSKAEKALPAKAKGFLPFEKLSRYKFSMIYYPESSRWKVNHDFSGSSEQFDQLSGPGFLAFVGRFLPKEKQKHQLETPQKKGWKEEIHPIELFGKHKKWEGKTIRSSVPLRAEFNLPAKGKADGHWHYDARVFARSLENAAQTFIGEVEAGVPPTGKISVPLHLESLRPGIYRIVAQVGLDEEGIKKEELKGSRLVQVV